MSGGPLRPTGLIVAEDADGQIIARQAQGGSRSRFRIVEASTVIAKVRTGPASASASGNSRYRIAHGLSAVPNLVVPMRMSSPIVATGNSDVQNSVEYASCIVGTCHPVADSIYSYFTVARPTTSYHEYNTTLVDDGTTGTYTITFDASWGTPKGAVVNWKDQYPSFGISPAGSLMWQKDGQTVVFRSTSNVDINLEINFSVFFDQSLAKVQTVRVFSAVCEGLTRDNEIPTGPGAHAAPDSVSSGSGIAPV